MITLQLPLGSNWSQLDSERFTFRNFASSSLDWFPALSGLVSRTAELLTCVGGSRRKFPSFRTRVRFLETPAATFSTFPSLWGMLRPLPSQTPTIPPPIATFRQA